MNEQRRQTREILQLEIELARLKVRAEHIRLRQIKQRRRTRTANLVRTVPNFSPPPLPTAAAAVPPAASPRAPCAACGRSPGWHGISCSAKTTADKREKTYFVFRRPPASGPHPDGKTGWKALPNRAK
ncbi:hypothetical protein [Kingella potus]|uniref:hypothetical protein n=1 Tax=Kingella potus TaxID=265175 RepID=UPI001FD3FDD6|nr:hypothetical protein [Kingella potus]UOP00897.1 hypothetical protein LVJ84_00225 [Kingella potus]